MGNSSRTMLPHPSDMPLCPSPLAIAREGSSMSRACRVRMRHRMAQVVVGAQVALQQQQFRSRNGRDLRRRPSNYSYSILNIHLSRDRTLSLPLPLSPHASITSTSHSLIHTQFVDDVSVSITRLLSRAQGKAGVQLISPRCVCVTAERICCRTGQGSGSGVCVCVCVCALPNNVVCVGDEECDAPRRRSGPSADAQFRVFRGGAASCGCSSSVIGEGG